jgi:diguanylate cyclase (GGDEF)-like protein
MRFVIFASFAGISGQLRAALDREKAQARRDSLTGLLNVRGFLEAADAELTRSRRHRRPITIAFLDCDNFKHVNDQLGHSTGNELLTALGRSLVASIRGSDLAARMGGDEFVLLFPELDGRAARLAVEKSLALLAATMREHDWPVTFSVGLASFATPPDSVDELVRAADDLMYEAKRSGKNTVRSVEHDKAVADHAPALAC